MTASEHAEYICAQFNKFRKTKTLCDAVLVTADREFPVHRAVLASASQIFRDTFFGITEPIPRVHIVGTDSSVVEVALDVIYLGEIRLPAEYVDAESLGLLFRHLRDLGINDHQLTRVTEENVKLKPGTADGNIHNEDEGRESLSITHSTALCENQTKNDISKTIESVTSASVERQNSEASDDQVIPNSIKYITIKKPVSSKSDKNIGESDKIGKKAGRASEYITRPMKAYVCSICNKAFSQPNYLIVHMRSHTGEQPFECNQCSAQFSQRANLQRHEQLHTGRRPHLCDLCGRSFTQKATLQEHMLLHGQGKPLLRTCGRCGEKCVGRKALYRHVAEKHCELRGRDRMGARRALLAKPHVCGHCGRAYATLSSLRLHQRIHESNLEECGTCGKKYISISLLRQHIATHTREKKHACNKCGKAFLYSTALSVHKRLHTGAKPYHCQYCDKRFAQYGHLQSHMRTHTGEKPFICDTCGKAYKQRADLKLHKKKSAKCTIGQVTAVS